CRTRKRRPAPEAIAAFFATHGRPRGSPDAASAVQSELSRACAGSLILDEVLHARRQWLPSLGVVSPDRRIERGAFGSRGQIRRCCPHDHLVATPLLPCQATIDGRRPLGEIVSAGLSLLLFFVGRPSRN